jgi:hypothetical protein
MHLDSHSSFIILKTVAMNMVSEISYFRLYCQHTGSAIFAVVPLVFAKYIAGMTGILSIALLLLFCDDRQCG